MVNDDVLTTREVAERLGVRPETLRKMVQRGIIPEVRLGHKVRRYIWADVVAALKAQTTPAAGGRS